MQTLLIGGGGEKAQKPQSLRKQILKKCIRITTADNDNKLC